MSSLKRYKKRLNNLSTSVIDEMRENYNNYLNNAPNQFEYIIKKSGKSGICTIIDSNKGNEDSKSDNKFMTVPFNCDFTVGDNLIFNDERFSNNHFWLVNDQEMLGVASHRRFMIRPCNEFMRIKSNNIIYSLPMYLTNKTLYTPGLKFDEQVLYSDVVMNGIMSLTEDGCRYVKEHTRFMLDVNGVKKIFKITSIDALTENILTFRSTADTLLKEDDLENNIAFNDYNNSSDNEVVEYEIIGDTTISTKSEYSINPIPSDSFRFEIDNNSMVDIEVTNKTCILTPKKGGDWVTLSAICDEKDIKLEKFIFVKGGV